MAFSLLNCARASPFHCLVATVFIASASVTSAYNCPTDCHKPLKANIDFSFPALYSAVFGAPDAKGLKDQFYLSPLHQKTPDQCRAYCLAFANDNNIQPRILIFARRDIQASVRGKVIKYNCACGRNCATIPPGKDSALVERICT